MTELPQTPSFRLDGKRALIAGASSGIGLGAATALAEAGADVVLTARRTGPLCVRSCPDEIGPWRASSSPAERPPSLAE